MSIHIDLSDHEKNELEKVADILNVEVDHVAKLMVLMGSAYINNVAKNEVTKQELSVFVHGLLQVPQFPSSLENN